MAEDTEDKEELSMEDILSSIKDILMEDNAEQHKAAQKEEPAPQVAAPQPAPEVSRPAPAETVDDVLTLSPSMIVEPNISTVEAQPETKAEEGADPLDLDFDREFDSLPAEPVLDDIEAGHSAAVDEEPVGLSEIAAAEDAEIVEDSELPDLNFDEPAVDLDADPIFSVEDDASHQENFTPAADDVSLDNLVDDDTLNAILNANADESAAAAQEEELVEPTDNVYDNAVAEAVKEPEVIDAAFEEVTPAAEVAAPEPEIAPEKTVSETTPAEKSKPEDPIDVSAGIISNFAKMFAEQQKQKENPAEREKLKERLTAQTMSEIELGDGSLTIEAIVRDVVTGIVEKNLAQDFDFSAAASAEITRQTREWLSAHLPEIVETAVRKEIERVMAKVSS